VEHRKPTHGGLPLNALPAGVDAHGDAERGLALPHDRPLPDESAAPSAEVRHVRQGGLLWAGAPDGIARYDGRRTVVFRARPGVPDALPNSTPQALAEGVDGTLWAGTAAGVCRLADEARRRFEFLGPRFDALWGVPGRGDNLGCHRGDEVAGSSGGGPRMGCGPGPSSSGRAPCTGAPRRARRLRLCG